MKIWAKTMEYSEGKYLVVRRDGTIPEWPHFVMGGDDPCVPFALRAYAMEAESRGYDPEYVASLRELADDFSARTGGKADPDAGPHRKDNPAIIAMMRGYGDLTKLHLWIKAACDAANAIWESFSDTDDHFLASVHDGVSPPAEEAAA